MPVKLIFILLLMTGGFKAIAQGIPYDPKDFIEWNENYTLSWDAFLADVDVGVFGDAGTAVKIIANPYMIGSDIYYDVYALFNKSKSWCHKKSPELLSHEQLHFDLAEVTARQIRKEVERLRNEKVQEAKIFNAAVQSILDASNTLDARYDKETLHGVIAEKQHEWQQYVARELNNLSSYSRKSLKRTVGANKLKIR